MKPPSITPATEAEREWATAIMAGSEPWITLGRSLEQCRARVQCPDYLLFVSHRDGAASGFMLVQRHGVAGSPYVASLAVAEQFRGFGIGSCLLEFAEAFFRPEAAHIFLLVSSFNHRARALYERLGYNAIAELKDFVIPGASEILMQKRIAPNSANQH